MTGFTLHLTALYAGILTLLQIALSINVVRNRARSKVLYSDGGDETLARAMRTHGNFIEYVPMAIILMGIVRTRRRPGVGATHLRAGADRRAACPLLRDRLAELSNAGGKRAGPRGGCCWPAARDLVDYVGIGR